MPTIYHKNLYHRALACICPQIMGAFPASFWSHYHKMPNADTHRLVWNAKPGRHPSNLTINPHYKEPVL